MAHFLEACVQCTKLLLTMYYTMYTCDLKKEERDAFFQAESIFIIKLLSDVRDKFFVEYLRKVDKTNLLVSSTFNIANNAANDILRIDTPNADKFCDSLAYDQNGNVMLSEEGHKIRLSNYHKSKQNVTIYTRLTSLKEKCAELKEKILNNMNKNILEQCSKETNYYPWSGLDLTDTAFNIEQRIDRISSLIQTSCSDTVHEVHKFAGNQTSG